MSTPTLVVFDFDWSLINENSDTYVIEQLGGKFLYNELKLLQRGEYSERWTELMDLSLCKLYDAGVSVAQLDACLQATPVFGETLEAARYAAACGAELAILSDANTHYIEICLQKYGLAETFSRRATNPSLIEGGRLRITPYQPSSDPHQCPLCPTNLCKGGVLTQWLQEGVQEGQEAQRRVVYIGDGGGDFCPSMRLKPTDLVLCRRDWTLHKKCVGAGAAFRATLLPWSDGAELLAIFREHIK
ncbi:putative pyridoxal phosphate phosphatase PHOSPHO2 [Ochromonadaceae sp. CCMP2298]|nr:putative pyridoxal phosphate phosphatase PHOSPHO2 [Ochromonadaceae sp. CCMP2298]